MTSFSTYVFFCGSGVACVLAMMRGVPSPSGGDDVLAAAVGAVSSVVWFLDSYSIRDGAVACIFSIIFMSQVVAVK